MATRRAKAVLRIKYPTDYRKVMDRTQVVIPAMTKNSNYYPFPNPALAALQAQYEILEGYLKLVLEKKVNYIQLRNEASILLHRMLQEELIYVNQMGNGDAGILRLSGFEVWNESFPSQVPDMVIVKRIVKGLEPHTVKIFICSLKLRNVIYLVQTRYVDETDDKWKLVLYTENSKQLIIPNMVMGIEVMFRVAALKNGKLGLYSNPVSFIQGR